MGVHMRVESILIRLITSLLIVWPAGNAVAIEAGVLSGTSKLGFRPDYRVDLRSTEHAGFSVIRPACLQAQWLGGERDAEPRPLAVDISKRTDQTIQLHFTGPFILSSTEGTLLLRSSCPLNVFELSWPVFVTPTAMPDVLNSPSARSSGASAQNLLSDPLPGSAGGFRDFEPRSLVGNTRQALPPNHSLPEPYRAQINKANSAPTASPQPVASTEPVSASIDSRQTMPIQPKVVAQAATQQVKPPSDSPPTIPSTAMPDWPVSVYGVLGLSLLGALGFAVWWRRQQNLPVSNRLIAEPSIQQGLSVSDSESDDQRSAGSEPPVRVAATSDQLLRTLLSAEDSFLMSMDMLPNLTQAVGGTNGIHQQETAIRNALRWLDWDHQTPWQVPEAYDELVTQRNRTLSVVNEAWPKWIQWHLAFVELAYHEAKQARSLSTDTSAALLMRLGDAPVIDPSPGKLPDMLLSQLTGKLFEIGSPTEQALFIGNLNTLTTLAGGCGSAFTWPDFPVFLMQHTPANAV
ncbi:hypothetical protein NQT62_06315 [Limnobacter humi]|uniref:Uncharacterized protein n=1 Tax=Limnobacter humi TaxID=1778671 RepID=A0ABT1WEU9_9BURK|nr:hypothetical protein [Limnobacter humi]MCQ8896050.1 hypothetical protein [Limnobacter humi]